MKKKLSVHPDGTILGVVPVDHVWGPRDLEGGRYQKKIDMPRPAIEHMRKRRMHIDKSGKFAMLPEEEWPETLQAKQELFENDKSKLKAQIDEGKFTENPDGSYNLQKVVADLIQKKVL